VLAVIEERNGEDEQRVDLEPAFHPTKRINQMFFESQLPHKFFNFLFTITN
jgi:hypothetical protein